MSSLIKMLFRFAVILLIFSNSTNKISATNIPDSIKYIPSNIYLSDKPLYSAPFPINWKRVKSIEEGEPWLIGTNGEEIISLGYHTSTMNTSLKNREYLKSIHPALSDHFTHQELIFEEIRKLIPVNEIILAPKFEVIAGGPSDYSANILPYGMYYNTGIDEAGNNYLLLCVLMNDENITNGASKYSYYIELFLAPDSSWREGAMAYLNGLYNRVNIESH